ncbi:MAG: hypothetical protein ACOCQR_02345 [bacterium]
MKRYVWIEVSVIDTFEINIYSAKGKSLIDAINSYNNSQYDSVRELENEGNFIIRELASDTVVGTKEDHKYLKLGELI